MGNSLLRTAALITLAVISHIMVQQNLVSLLPLPVFLSTLLVWLVPSPGYFLIALAVVGELLSGLPPGITTLIVVLPVLIFRLRGRIQADVSFSFFLLLLATFTAQLLILAIPHLWPLFTNLRTWQALGQAVPWPLLGLMVLVNSVAAWLIAVALVVLFPPRYQPSSLFDRQRYTP